MMFFKHCGSLGFVLILNLGMMISLSVMLKPPNKLMTSVIFTGVSAFFIDPKETYLCYLVYRSF